MDAKLNELKSDKQEEVKTKQTDLLIKSIIGLNKNFVKELKNEDDKKSKLGSNFSMKTIGDALKSKGTDRIKSVKDMFSIKNALAMVGAGPGSLLGEIAQNREEGIKSKQDAVEKRKASAEIYAKESESGLAWKEKFDTAMKKGDDLSEEERNKLTEEYNELLKKGNELYESRLVMEKRITELETSEKDAESAGIKLSEGKQKELEQLRKDYNPQKEAKKNKPGVSGRGSQFLKGTATPSITKETNSGMIKAPPREGAPTEDMMSVLERKMREADMKQHPELYPDAAQVTVEAPDSPIVKVLNDIKTAVTVTEEDKLEAKKPTSTVEKIKNETPANPVEKKSMLDRAKALADLVKGGGKAILEKAEGGVGSTLMNGAKSLLGGIGLGTIAAGAAAVTGLAGAGQAIFGENGVMKGGSGKNFVSDFVGDHLGIGAESDEKIARDQAKLAKPATTAREVQTANLEQSTADAANIAAKETAGSNKGPAVVDASVKSVTNNNTVNTKQSPPVRNFEPSFNTRLRSQFA